ncbi:HNH endonuclease signature motif containing protein [Streptomyces bacillaris]|uniref:HNH endonuclease signature motif containing protein n=1 Tax=Streptomyces bacillaris TaxID=68179 RepID=UPI0036BAE813
MARTADDRRLITPPSPRPGRLAAPRARAHRGGDRVPPSLTGRFLDKVAPGPLGCWDWTAHVKPNGYGQFKVAGRPQYAHRVAYELVRGPIPRGLVIDHLCRRRHCVNPDHLEVVTTRTNIRRGISPAARRARQTHCARGHRFNHANTYRAPNGTRHCRPCAARRARDRRRGVSCAPA